MTCCDHQCNQGRDCPARVAKVGQGIPAAEPLPPGVWRDQLRHLSAWVLVVIWMLFCASAFVVGVLT